MNDYKAKGYNDNNDYNGAMITMNAMITSIANITMIDYNYYKCYNDQDVYNAINLSQDRDNCVDGGNCCINVNN